MILWCTPTRLVLVVRTTRTKFEKSLKKRMKKQYVLIIEAITCVIAVITRGLITEYVFRDIMTTDEEIIFEK